MRLLKEEDGSIVGRLFLHPIGYKNFRHECIEGAVTIGGLYASGLSGLFGILIGESDRASRHVGIPIVSDKILKEWAEEQAVLLSNDKLPSSIEADCASLIRAVKGNPIGLKYATNKDGWINNDELREMISHGKFDEYIIVQDAAIYHYESKNKCKIQLNENVIYTEMGIPGILQCHDFINPIFWPHFNEFDSASLRGLVIEIIANAWNLNVKDIKNNSDFSTDEKRYSAEIGTANGIPVIIKDVDIIRRTKK